MNKLDITLLIVSGLLLLEAVVFALIGCYLFFGKDKVFSGKRKKND